MSTLNGATGKRSPAANKPPRRPSIAPGAIDPMSRILAVGPRIPVAFTVALAISLHAGAAAGATAAALFLDFLQWNRALSQMVAMKLSQYEIEIEKEPPPPPEPPKEEEEKPAVKEDTPPPPKDAPPPPPPAAAAAAKVLTQEPDPKEPVDLTANTFVTGASSAYAGGVTQTGGTSKAAVYNPLATATGVPGGTGTAPAPPSNGDRSRLAGLLGSTDWRDCPFPPEADAEQIDQAYVTIQVKVKSDGSAETVAILQDPGHGFAREARKCAMRNKYSSAQDAAGNAVAGQTKPIRVRFER